MVFQIMVFLGDSVTAYRVGEQWNREFTRQIEGRPFACFYWTSAREFIEPSCGG